MKGSTIDNCVVTILGKLECIWYWAIICHKVWIPIKLTDSWGEKNNVRQLNYPKMQIKNPFLYFSKEISFLGKFIAWGFHPTGSGGRHRITYAEKSRKRTDVVWNSFVWNAFSVLEAKTRAQITFLQVKDSLPFIELRPAWLISVYSHSSCKRSLPSPRGAGLHVMELQSDPPLLQFSSAWEVAQA